MELRGVVAALGALVSFLFQLPSAYAQGGWSIGPVPSWVVELGPPKAANPTSAADDVAGVRVLLLDRQIDAAPLRHEEFVRSVSRITATAGLDTLSQLTVELDPSHESIVLHGVSVHRDGETRPVLKAEAVRLVQRERDLEAQTIDGRQSVVFFVDDLRVGDIVEYAYTRRGADPTLRGHIDDGFPLGGVAAVDRLHVRLRVEGRPALRFALRGDAAGVSDGELPPTGGVPRVEGGSTVYEWDRRDVPAYPTDPNAPGWYVPYPWIQVSDFATWEEVSAFGLTSMTVASPVNGELVDWVKQKRWSAGSEEAFILKATRFVQDEIRYVAIETGVSRRRPSPPDVVFRRRFGDCKDKAVLLVAMLRLAGIDARPAFVSLHGGGGLGQALPSIAVFDHVIVQVGTHALAPLWIDATAKLQGGGMLPLRGSLLRRALPLLASGGALTKLPPPELPIPSPSVSEHFRVAAPGTPAETELGAEISYGGDDAESMRLYLAGHRADEIDAYFLGSYQRFYPGIRALEPAKVEDDRERDIVRFRLRYAVPTFLEVDARGVQRLSAPAWSLLAELDRPLDQKRRAPFALTYPLRATHLTDIELPFAFAVKPQHTVTEHESFVLESTVTAESERHFYLSHQLTTRQPDVAADEVRSLATRVDAARAELGATFTWVPPIADGPNRPIALVLGGAALVALLGALGVYRHDPVEPRPPADARTRPDALGGALYLLAASVALQVVVRLWALVEAIPPLLSSRAWRAVTEPGTPTYVEGVGLRLVLSAVTGLALCAYALVLLVLFFQRRRSFPLHFTIYASASVVIAGYMGLFVSPQDVGAGVPSALSPGVSAFVLVWAGGWHAYLTKVPHARRAFTARWPGRRTRAKRTPPKHAP